MRRYSVVIGLIALAVQMAGSQAAASEIRVMSFNIRFGAANDGDNVWPNRKQLVAETIKRYNPDLLGTQETLPFQAEFLQEQLPEYTYIGWSRDESENGEQCGLFFRTERFQRVDAGQFWLSETPEEKFSKSWDSSLPRVATWVTLIDKQQPDLTLFFINTHFDHRGVQAREKSAELLRARIEKVPEDLMIVLTGDFNTAEKSPPWQTLTESNRLIDTYRQVYPQAQSSEGTFHGFQGTPGKARIDWVLCSPQFTSTSATIDRTNEDGRYPSDHFPVTAVLTRKQK
jgi:endonuclease/exonuclease/phosphatase family metal-dependent hydrolase